MTVPALTLQNVNVSLGGKLVLEDINLSLPDTGFLGLIGPNGAGKTVLIKTIAGIIKPDSGVVEIGGKRPNAARGTIGYVPQHASFDGSFPISVMDVVLMGRLGNCGLLKNYSEDDRARAEQSLERVSMAEHRNVQIGQLSGGQIQRVLIARALVMEPKLLLLDEPTASLDTRIGQSFYELLQELNKTMTIILASHDIGVISSFVKTIACLNRKLHYHESKEIKGDIIAEVYGCPVDLIAHGHAHRVLPPHGEHS